jgi:HEPN domain-containing protein
MKPTSTFKLSKQNKRFLATVVDAHARGHYKRMLIDAQLASEIKIKDKKSAD